MREKGSAEIAGRYASALLDVALAAGDGLDQLVADFADFDATLGENASLLRAFEAGGLPVHRRVELARELIARHTENENLRRFVVLMVSRERGASLPSAFHAFRLAVDSHRGITDVRLVSAHPLSEAEAERLSDALGKALGIEPRLHREVDPAILGGFVARVGNRIYDASVERELRRFEENAS